MQVNSNRIERLSLKKYTHVSSLDSVRDDEVDCYISIDF